VAGILQPRLVIPADFARRFSDEERRLIRAHEIAHIERHDCRLGALAVAAGWICWFNPLAWLAVSAFRGDQEFACDATVMERLPRARRAYAETMLRAQPLAQEAAFVLHWRAGGRGLESRLQMLARRPPSQLRRDLGLAALITLCAGSFGAAWATQPPPPRPYAAPASIRMDFAAPEAGEAAWVNRWWSRPSAAE
jgi:beta-lactamase regulating signal transducer with metallopeptidase domain